jgi:hypothetical protein
MRNGMNYEGIVRLEIGNPKKYWSRQREGLNKFREKRPRISVEERV